MDSKTVKEARRKKSLGELGELFALKALVDKGYKVSNTNDLKMNSPFVDLLAEKDGKRFVVSVKARNKIQKDRKLNASYKLGDAVYEKAVRAAEKFGADPYWLAVQFDVHTYSVYFGSLLELEGGKRIPVDRCMRGEVGTCLVGPDKKHYFDFDYFINERIDRATSAT